MRRINLIDSLCVLLSACRVEHWIKNLLILFPVFFVNQLFEREVLFRAAPSVLSFSFVASAVYLINDIKDVEKDRQHAVKKNRPIANGRMSIGIARAIAILFAAVGLVLTLFASNFALSFFTLLAYLVVNIGYSIKFKNIALVDVFVLASGFVFRVFYGGFYFSIPISSWLFLCVFSAALFFALGKRRAEYKKYADDLSTRPVLARYSEGYLNAHYYICCALTILFYCLWTISRTDQHAVGKLALTIPLVVFIIFRYNYIVEAERCDADPVPAFLHDKWLVVSSMLFVFCNFVILYFGSFIPRLQY